ncbi:hypothetical protein M1349_01655 [Patescibacteria group bacterium]|nr:hypothetical protein [Patescibacteria group bacterium]
MSNSIKILPEDRIQLTQDQKNLIELAFAKQVPPEDAKFMEKVQKEKVEEPYDKLSEYFTNKYGVDFGMIFLSAIMGGKEKYQETVGLIEKVRAEERIKNLQKN